MKGIKKCLLLALSFAMSATLFAACGGGKGDDNSSSVSGNPESSSVQGGNGSESDSEIKLPDVSVEVPDVEDVNGSPVANAEEWNTIFRDSLAATNATIITTASESGTVMEDGIVMIAGGVTYEKWDNMDGTSSYYFWGEVDGQNYHWQSEDGKTWTVAETDRTPDDYATVAYELKGLAKMLTFEGATWNAETGMYTGTSEEGDYSLKIADGKVVYISFYIENAMMPGVDCVYQIVYGQTAAMQLPALGGDETPDNPDNPDNPESSDKTEKPDNSEKPTPGDSNVDSSGENSGSGSASGDVGGGDIELPEIPDVDGEEIKDEAAWKAAWANTNNANNFVVAMTENYNGEEDVMFLTAADGKSYMYGEYANGEREYIYYGTVDGKVYEWYSEDGKTWEVEEFFNDIAVVTTPAGIARGIDQRVNFSDVTYEKGYYLFSYEGVNFRVKFAGGYVIEFAYTDTDGEGQSYKLAYGNAEVGELPPLPQEDVVIGGTIADAEQWAKILANTDEQTNFNRTASGRVERDDGKISVMTEQIAVENGNVYLERESAVHSGSGNASVGQTCYYQGVVDGVAYQWNYMGGEYSVQQIEAVTDNSTIVELLGLEELSFAAAQFDSETGTYTFAADGATIGVRVVNGLICYVELTTDNMSVEYTITYGNANVELPSLSGGGNNTDPSNPNPDTGVDYSDIQFTFDMNVGQGIIGEEVSAEILKKAITETLCSTNFTVQGKGYVQGGSTLFAANVANGKMYNVTKATYPTEENKYETMTLHTIVGTVNGVDWAWMSFDGVSFEDGPAEDVIRGGWRDGNDMFGTYLQVFLAGGYTFNESTGEYIVEADGATIAIKIVGGEVKTIYMTSGDDNTLYVITYNNAVDFNLPPVTDGGSGGSTSEMPSKEEWDYAFKELLQSENLSVKTVSETEYTYGKYVWSSAQYQYDGKAIEYSLENKSNDGSDDTRQRMVLANENGEDTQYVYSYDTSIWTKADSALFSVAEFWGMQTYSWERFADIYEQMQWDGNYFYLAEFTYVSGDGYKSMFYDIRINIVDGQVMEISYRTEEMDYSMQTAIFFYEYDQTKVVVPVDGQGDIGGESGGDVGGGEGGNVIIKPEYPDGSGDGEMNETVGGEVTDNGGTPSVNVGEGETN